MTTQQQIVYAALSEHILNIRKDAPVIVAINGKDGSGKTMMANILANVLSSKTNREIIRISIDDFMNNRAVRYTPSESAGRGCYEYTFNFDAFINNVLEPLQSNGSWEYRTKIFDHATDSESLSPVKKASKGAVIIIDGVFLYKQNLLHYWDVKILLDTDDETVIERGAQRDAERLGSYEVAKQKYIDRYIASQAIYYAEESPQKRADIIIDNNNVELPFIVKDISLS